MEMKFKLEKLFSACFILIFLFGLTITAQTNQSQSPREKLLMDWGWKFHLGNAASVKDDFNYGNESNFDKAGGGQGPIASKYDDYDWRTVDLPHDWAVEQDFVYVKNEDLNSHGYKPVGRIFPETTIGWYRKSFLVSKEDEGKKLSILFGGVFRDCIVWLNGHYIGRNFSGYSEFSFDVTDYINYGKKNVMVVRADASQYEGWFYEGAGIYRHVWLIKTDPLAIKEYGVFVTTEVKEKSADVKIETEIFNQRNSVEKFDLESAIIDKNGKQVALQSAQSISLDSFEQKKHEQKLNVANPKLWSIEEPNLYKLVSTIKIGGKIIDQKITEFGIRTLLWDKDKGFFLNGKHVEIQGMCNHQDHAGVGSALPDRLQYYRIERLKEMGVNAYRTSHNPPTVELLEACDRLGMLVMDENRLMGSSEEMLAQYEKLVLRDRNHPSVFLWSIGNEESYIHNREVGRKIAESLMRVQKKLDPTRLGTYAANNGNTYEGINSVMPIRGFNYMNIADIDKYRKDHPDQILFGSEEASTLCTRGIYANDSTKGYVDDYDHNRPRWGSLTEPWWKFYDARPWLAGAFVWTGFDYRGEPTPYSWPCISSHFGVLDVCGFPKNNFYYYQAWWTDKDVLHIYPHWNWKGKEGQPINVWVQSNCKSVELFLNGKSLGKKNMEKDSHLEWNVPYEPGTLEAKGIKNGKVIKSKIETTGEAVKIKLTPDRAKINADGEDISILTVTAVDSNGKEIPVANNLIKFEVEGNGKIIGVGNGDPSSHEADKYLDGKYQRKLFNGKCQVIVQSNQGKGDIKVKAASENLKDDEITINTYDVAPRAAVVTENLLVYKHLALRKNVEYKNECNTSHTGGGKFALVNGLFGSTDYSDGYWQGFEKSDLEVVIGLGEAKSISKIETNFLNDNRSRIFLPAKVTYSISDDGKAFREIFVEDKIDPRPNENIIKKFTAQLQNVKGKYVKVFAQNIRTVPEWHSLKGEKARLFVDEVVVE
jgi:beta-galactosidase